MSRKIADQVVVITGASSGIGKATALTLARQGARLVLAARREHELEDTAIACRAEGGEAVSVPTDVSDEGQVKALAARAIAEFGRIDVWFNNAGVDVFGRFEDVPTESFERVIQINLLGTTYGARAVLPHFMERGSGIIINNASMVGTCPSPFHTAYVATKFAIRGFSHALRQELIPFPDIHVCTISPSSIDTPLWQRAGNYSGHKIKPLDPVHPTQMVADFVVELVRLPQREVFPGASGWILAEQYAAEPELTETMVAGYARQSLFQDEPAEPSAGSLFKPEPGYGGVSGGWMSPDRPGIPSPDVVSLAAAPALLALAPSLYAWKLSYNFFQQVGQQFTASATNGQGSAMGWPSGTLPPSQRPRF